MENKNPNKSKKKKRIVYIVILVFALLIGFAYLSTTLDFFGTITADPNTWGLHWEIVNYTYSSGVTVQEFPTLIEDDTVLTDEFTLNKPGDYVEITLDVVNDGTIDAMIDSLTISSNGSHGLPNYLKAYVVYENGVYIGQRQIIRADSSVRIRIRVTFSKYIEEGNLPSEPQTLQFSFAANYVQADDSATETYDEVVYTVNDRDNMINIMDYIPIDVDLYDSSDDAMEAFGAPICLKHWLLEDKVVSSAVVFRYQNVTYEDLIYGPAFYERNINFISNLFVGTTRGSLPSGNYDIPFIDVYGSDDNTMGAMLSDEGAVSIAMDGYSCTIALRQACCSIPETSEP